MNVRYLAGAALLLLAPTASAQLDVTIKSAVCANLPAGQAWYTVTGCASGYAGNNYTITVQIKDSFNVVIASKTQLVTDDGAQPDAWGVGLKGPGGGTTACVTLAEAPGDAGPTASAPVVCGPKVPTMSEWGVLLLVLLLMTGGAFFVLRRAPAGTA